MDLSKIVLNEKIPNYRRLCELIGEKVKGGKSKVIQMAEIKRFLELEKIGNAFYVRKIYEQPKEKIRKTKEDDKRITQYDNFLPKRFRWKDTGVYCIKLDNDIYIGSTTTGFRLRFTQHIKGSSTIPAVLNILNNGATFDILWTATDEDEQTIRKIEQDFIEKYKKLNWNVINSRDTFSYTVKKPKCKIIRVEESNFEKALELLKENGLI